ncbi:hypothetical protein MIC448_140002 [Microbacterium sp. C448]|uniref:hypothetical protein n=1 Tax=Microbacterium TaxID=33882 RepID=UPI0003DE2F02|nr:MULTISPECIES: hypothetical protein [Microbacterium]CDJ99369.1 hypothetical protein MIC448_140002 [Microbacterium sp. C448]
MREIIIGGRSITVSHVKTETTEYGDIQRYRIDVSGSDAVTHLSSLRSSPNIDARVMASVIDTELLLGYEGSAESGLLRDPGIRAWRDQHRPLIEQALDRLRDEMKDLPPEPVSDVERLLLRAFDINANDEVRGA